jgi:hypothetical protein
MTELEQLLSTTLERVSNEFRTLLAERDGAITSLSQQVLDLSTQVEHLSEQLEQQSIAAAEVTRRSREDLHKALTLLLTKLGELAEV